jgi:hypothetical protein
VQRRAAAAAARVGAHRATANCIQVDASTFPVVGVAIPARFVPASPPPTCARTREDAARGVDVAGSSVRGGGVARAARRNGATPTRERKLLGRACIGSRARVVGDEDRMQPRVGGCRVCREDECTTRCSQTPPRVLCSSVSSMARVGALLALLALSLSGAQSKITDVTVKNDDRNIVLIARPFGFSRAGVIEVHMRNDKVFLPEDAPPFQQDQKSKLGFFITTAEAEVRLQSPPGLILAPACALSPRTPPARAQQRMGGRVSFAASLLAAITTQACTASWTVLLGVLPSAAPPQAERRRAELIGACVPTIGPR